MRNLIVALTAIVFAISLMSPVGAAVCPTLGTQKVVKSSKAAKPHDGAKGKKSSGRVGAGPKKAQQTTDGRPTWCPLMPGETY